VEEHCWQQEVEQRDVRHAAAAQEEAAHAHHMATVQKEEAHALFCLADARGREEEAVAWGTDLNDICIKSTVLHEGGQENGDAGGGKGQVSKADHTTAAGDEEGYSKT
jgi:hypothetical protein